MSTRPGVASGHQSVHLRMCELPSPRPAHSPPLGHNKWQQQHFVSSPLSLFRTLYLPVASLSHNANSKSRARGDNALMTCSTTLHVAGNWPSSRGRGSGRGLTAAGVTWPFGEISMLMRPLGTYQSDKASKRRSSSCGTSASKSF